MTFPPLREELRGIEPYGAPQLDVPVQLNVNENPYAPGRRTASPTSPPRSRRPPATLNRYPDREFTELRDGPGGVPRPRHRRRVAPEQVWAANGSNEVMLQLLQAFGGPGRTALSFAPTYSMYPEYARDTMHRAGSSAAASRTSPSTSTTPRALIAEQRPTSCCCPRRTTRPAPRCRPTRSTALCEAAGDGLVVVDEAYAEFRRAGTPERARAAAASTATSSSRRTMSKAFALAGARLGYLAADAGVCDALRVVRLPYHLSAVTQAAARAALRHADELLAQVDDLRAERDAHRRPGCASRGCTVADSRRQLRAVRHASPTGTPSGRACSTAAC